MDFRIRNIKNHDSLPMQKQTDPMLSVLRELTEVIKLSHQHFIDNQKERLETRQVLLQIKSSLDQKEQALKAVSQEIQKISEKTVDVLTDICQKINMGKSQGRVNESEPSNEIPGNEKSGMGQKFAWQGFDKKSEQIINKIEEITVTPPQPRNIPINVKSSRKESEKPQEKIKCIKSDVAKLSNKVFSVSFNMFFKERIDFEKIKAYCSENMLGNLIEMIQQKQTTVDEIQMIDQHLSNMVLPFLKLSYPHSEEKETSLKLASLIVDKDIFDENRFDILYNSPIKKMTWHGLEEEDISNDNNKTEKQFMKLINYTIKLPDQPSNDSQDKTLFESFQKDMAKTFGIIFNKDLTQLINSGDYKMRPQYNEKGKFDSVTTLVQMIEKSAKLSHQTQKEISQYRENVKSYTKYKIGRKISANSKLYTESQIQKGRLTIKDQSIRRIITKWIQSLQQKFQNPVDFAILRNELLKLDDGTQNNNEGIGQKEILFELIKQQSKKIKQKYGKIKRNLYQTFRETIINQQCKLFDSQFCSQRQASVGNTCTILYGATEGYIIKYLVDLINSLKDVELGYYSKSYGRPQNQRKPLLVNFKLGDLMRCQLSSKESEVLTIYKFLLLLCEKIPDKFELVRVKNRFNGPNKDILINIWYHRTVMVEIQLAIKNESPFLERSDKYSHFIYELRRDILGPISELASVWNKFSPKAQFFHKQYKVKLRNCLFINNKENACSKQSHSFIQNREQTGLPFWCSNCKVFQVNEQRKIECRDCNKRICSMCRNTEEISKKYSNKRIKLNAQKLEKGMLAKGIEIKSKDVKLYFVMEFMGKMQIISFRNNNNQFSEIQTKFEQSNQQAQNESNFEYFNSHNYLISDEHTQIYQQKLISQIFTDFWQRKMLQVENKKKSALTIIFLSKPTLGKQKKMKVVNEILNITEKKKNQSSIEKLNISENTIQEINIIRRFKKLKSINMSKNKISTLEGFPQLSVLQQIYMQQNQLQSLKGLPSLTNLKKIYIRNNKISTLEGFPQLPVLQYINMQYNKLQSLKGLPSLTNLKKIYAPYNKISTLDGFPQLPVLQQIYMQQNQLQSLKGLPSLTNLKKIYADYNKISTLDGFPQLPVLQQIYMQQNQLQSLKGLPSLRNLKKIYIRNNKINTLDGFPQLPALQQIQMQYNQLQSLKGLPSLRNLKKIYIRNNKISTLEGFPQLPVLQQIQMQYNQLQSLKGLLSLTNLKKIYIRNNKISTLEGFPQLPVLQQIQMQYNQLQSLKGLLSLTNLKKIYADYNRISTLDGFPQLPALQQISLQKNQLQSLKGLPSLTNLKKIYAPYNKISTLDGFPQLPALQQISLQKNQLQSLKGLPSLTNLKKIYAPYNKISTLDGFPQLPALQQISLQKNQLQSLKGLPSLTNLKKIYADQNKISTLDGFPQLPALQQISLQKNQLQSLKGLPSLTNLKKIYADYNKISTLDGFPQLPVLQQISLQQNQLQSLKGLPSLTNLKKIYAHQNKISTLDGFPQLPALQQISLQKNQLQSLKGLPSLTNLKKIYAHQNKISTLDGFPQLPALQQISLQKNQLQSLKGLPSLTNLKKIYAPYNKISTLDGFPQLPALQQISLQKNQLQSLKGLPSLTNLKKIYADQNKISTLDGFPQLPALQQISLQKNQLQSLKGLPSLSNLKKIYIRNNKISTLDGFPQLPALSLIIISQNPINQNNNLSQKLKCLFPSLK